MTPELKTACEVVFQEHKISSQPIRWNRDAFRGRISVGLSEMAKETLVKKNIILLPDKSKKILTQLNPVVATAASFEEAEKIIVDKIPALVTVATYDADSYIAGHVYGFDNPQPKYSHQMITAGDQPETVTVTVTTETKWYLSPLFCYVIWPACAVVAGVFITRLITFVQAELFFG